MIQQLYLKNYRNIKDLEISLDEKCNYLHELNGSGKTNLLESIYFLTYNSSFRPTSGTSEYIGPEYDFAKVLIDTNTNDIETVISQKNSRISKQTKINGKRASGSKVINHLRVVLFAPHSVDLVGGEPATRRRDLDDFLCTCYGGYARALSSYKKVLKNRNAIIKQISEGNANTTELVFWTEKLLDLASTIYKVRYLFFEEIDEFIQLVAEQTYHDYKAFKAEYEPNLAAHPDDFRTLLSKKYEENQKKEIIVGRTLYGIHKDDYSFSLNGKHLRYFGSRGQQRIGSFLFKISQIEYLQNLKETETLLLVDDIMSELDTKHREQIAQVLLTTKNLQFIITAAVKSDYPTSILEGKRIELPTL